MMNGSERPHDLRGWVRTVSEVLTVRIRFAGLAYLMSISMLLTLVAGAFVTTRGGDSQAAAPAVELSPVTASSPLPYVEPDVAQPDQSLPPIEPQPEASAAPQVDEPPQPPLVRRFPPKAVASPQAAAEPARVPVPTGTPTVSITDGGFVPDQITVRAGEAVQWVNDGSKVHTATALNGGPRFDTGGLATHQSAKVAFAAPGTVSYSSATDCLNGNHDPGFTCNKVFSITITP